MRARTRMRIRSCAGPSRRPQALDRLSPHLGGGAASQPCPSPPGAHLPVHALQAPQHVRKHVVRVQQPRAHAERAPRHGGGHVAGVAVAQHAGLLQREPSLQALPRVLVHHAQPAAWRAKQGWGFQGGRGRPRQGGAASRAAAPPRRRRHHCAAGMRQGQHQRCPASPHAAPLVPRAPSNCAISMGASLRRRQRRIPSRRCTSSSFSTCKQAGRRGERAPQAGSARPQRPRRRPHPGRAVAHAPRQRPVERAPARIPVAPVRCGPRPP
jgi:hypothetical protein